MSLTGGHIRRAALADASALKEILYDTFESTWRPNVTVAAAQAFRSEDRPCAYVGERGLQFWVAERGGEVVGFVDWQDDFVNALHVLGRQARSGVGAALMDHAEAEIARAGFAQARLETDTFNQRSRAFYAKRGYVEAGRYPDSEWNSGITTLLLVKSLTPYPTASGSTL
jgi:ribosomal protein S18 acetylase RimI-like enzyme